MGGEGLLSFLLIDYSTVRRVQVKSCGLTDVVSLLLADALTAKGATHVPGLNFAENVIIDGRLATGQNPSFRRRSWSRRTDSRPLTGAAGVETEEHGVYR